MPRKALLPGTHEKVAVKAVAADSITFHYIKSNFFRVVHVDGAISGLTPQMGIHLGVFNERPAIPQQQDYRVSDGGLGEEVPDSRVGKSGIVRELEVELMLNEPTAQAIVQLLTDKLKLLKQFKQERKREGVAE